MRRAALSFAVLAILAFGLASAASAAIYTVTLANGATFDTRYPPEQASWDASKVVILTEFGNQISFSNADVQSVTVDTETRGFGHQLDATTMALGWAPNDSLDPDSDEGKAAAAAEQAQAAVQALAPTVYNQQQFVEPGALTGLPVWMSSPNAVPQIAPPSPGPQPVNPPN